MNPTFPGLITRGAVTTTGVGGNVSIRDILVNMCFSMLDCMFCIRNRRKGVIELAVAQMCLFLLAETDS